MNKVRMIDPLLLVDGDAKFDGVTDGSSGIAEADFHRAGGKLGAVCISDIGAGLPLTVMLLLT